MSCPAFLLQADPTLTCGFATLLDKLLKIGGLGVILADIGFCLIAEMGLAGGDEHGNMEPSTGVGSRLALT